MAEGVASGIDVTIKGLSQEMGDGKFQAAFVVTRHQSNEDDGDTKIYTGRMFETAKEAESAGLIAALDYLERERSRS